MEKLSSEEAYRQYRSDPAAFFSDRIHGNSNNESELINPEWHPYWTKYHYNLVENGILEILHEFKKTQCKLNILDIGSGTGHWIEFYNSLFDIEKIVGIDFSEIPLHRLRGKNLSENISFQQWDISTSIPQQLKSVQFDVINAIGVIFHIVDDKKWKQGIENLFQLLKPGAIMIIGGDFGSETKERGVMRKTRSLDMWLELVNALGGNIIALKRFDWWAGADNNGITDNLLAIQK